MAVFGKTRQTLVVDGNALLSARGQRGRPNPRQQIQMLRMLSRFAQRENVKMVAVLTGKPLHKAPKGKKFEGITVCYAADEKRLARELLKRTKKAGKNGVLVSADAKLETKALKAGGEVVRISTFRKSVDSEGEGGGENARTGRNDREHRSTRRGNNRRKKPQPKPGRDDEDDAGDDGDAISQMIDLVE